MEDPVVAMDDPTAANQVADSTPLGFLLEFFVEYDLGWVLQWVWTIFRLGFLVSFD